MPNRLGSLSRCIPPIRILHFEYIVYIVRNGPTFKDFSRNYSKCFYGLHCVRPRRCCARLSITPLPDRDRDETNPGNAGANKRFSDAMSHRRYQSKGMHLSMTSGNLMNLTTIPNQRDFPSGNRRRDDSSTLRRDNLQRLWIWITLNRLSGHYFDRASVKAPYVRFY